MTLRNRFLLVGFGIIVFVICTPVAVLYALGYQLDIETGQVTKTGSLVVKSEPTKSLVYIDGKLQKNKTNSTIRFLLPGDYNFTIDRDGYQSWTKRLNIRSGIVTWANLNREFVTLFYDAPKPKGNLPAEVTSVSALRNSATIINSTGVWSYDPNSQDLQQVSSETPAFNPPASLPDSESLHDFLRFEPARKFTAEQLATAKRLESNNEYAALLSAGNLYVSKDTGVAVFAAATSGFRLENENLWYVEGNYLKHANLNIGLIEQVATLPYAPNNSQVIRGDSQVFLILDQNAYALNDVAEEIQRGVTSAYWDNSSNRLIMSNANEVLTFDPGAFKTELVIRSSSTISEPKVNSQTGYLFFINEDKIKAIELDGRDHRNVYTITSEPAKAFLLSNDGKVLTTFTDTGLSWMEIR
jgi:hypothetical protein